jgi:hypothetical protein
VQACDRENEPRFASRKKKAGPVSYNSKHSWPSVEPHDLKAVARTFGS